MSKDDKAALERLLSSMTKLEPEASSGHLLVATESQSSERDGTPRRPGRTDVEVWFDGVRVREEIRTTERGATEERLWLFDGERVVQTSPPAFERALVGSPQRLDDMGKYGRMGLGNPLIDWQLRVSLYRRPSLGEQLPRWSAEPLRAAGEGVINGVSCQLIEVPQITMAYGEKVIQRLWVAPEKGYAVARFDQDVAVPPPGPVSRVVMVDEATDWLHPIEGLWLPRLVKGTRHHTDRATGQEWLHYRRTVEVVTAEFSVEIPESVFELELPEGTEIIPFDPDEAN